MIELDDAVTKLDIGLEEYIVLNALEVYNIRQFLLLDTERVLALKVAPGTVGERIAAWQKHLRKFITYEKLHGARKKDDVPMEKIRVSDTLDKLSFPATDVKIINSLGLKTILDFFDADIYSLMPEKKFDQETRKRIKDLQERLWNKDFVKSAIEESVLIEYIGVRATRTEAPEKTVSPDEFLDEPVEESGVNPNEVEVLEALNVKTVRDFLDLESKRIRDVKGYSEKVYTRIEVWQKYLRRRLHWEEK